MAKEYIEREAAINLLHYHADEACSAVVTDFEAILAADVVEVVRCKNCTEWNEAEGECSHWYGFRENDFCSHGESKEK